MPKSTKTNQRRKHSADNANLKPVSKRVRDGMGKTIGLLHSPPHSFTYEQISTTMGHESGYAHLIEHGGRVSPTKIEQQALEAMYQTALRSSNLFRGDIERRNKIISLCAQIMREVSEL